jgi:hypothetical protein
MQLARLLCGEGAVNIAKDLLWNGTKYQNGEHFKAHLKTYRA